MFEISNTAVDRILSCCCCDLLTCWVKVLISTDELSDEELPSPPVGTFNTICFPMDEIFRLAIERKEGNREIRISH